MRNKSRKRVILVSACLAGIGCRADGKTKKDKSLMDLLEKEVYFVICPEISAGFGVPRSRIEIKGGDGKDVLAGRAKVITEKGLEVTDKVVNAAKTILTFCREAGIKTAVLKEKSPSCGKNFIFDGTFSGKLVKGKGVAAALLEREGIKVFSEEEYKRANQP